MKTKQQTDTQQRPAYPTKNLAIRNPMINNNTQTPTPIPTPIQIEFVSCVDTYCIFKITVTINKH